MVSGATKKIVCFFLFKNNTVSYTVEVDTSNHNGEAEAIQALIEREGLNPYSLSFVLDNDKITYKAEYLHSVTDFQSRQHLIPIMETKVNAKVGVDAASIDNRIQIRTMSECDWIEKHGSGTLRKNKCIGFTYRTQYLAERVAYEFGYGFQILPRSQITFGDPISEENCHAITEAGWHIERYMMLDIFGDFVEAKYIHAAYRDNSAREGIGIIVRETSAPWVPAGHIIFALIAEHDPYRKVWKDAINPF